MKEIIFYAVIGISALFILGFSIHMLIGGLVSPQTEWRLIIAACLIGAAVMAWMAWDVIRRRRALQDPPG
jgi:threonine/homoserine/homoserine lactone efflux protein